MTYNNYLLTIDLVWDLRNLRKGFDFPDYGGLPKKLTNTFSSEVVDALQNIWDKIILSHSKYRFSRLFKAELLRLGERVVCGKRNQRLL